MNHKSGEGLLHIKDIMRCGATFDTVDKLLEAYFKLRNSIHGDLISEVKPKINTNLCNITIVMGIRTGHKSYPFVSLKGEVQLRFIPSSKEEINHLLYELERSDTIR